MRSTVEQLHADLSGDAVRAGAAVDRVISETDRLREAQVELGRRLDAVAVRPTPGPSAVDDRLHTLEARLQDLERAPQNERLDQLEQELREQRMQWERGLDQRTLDGEEALKELRDGVALLTRAQQELERRLDRQVEQPAAGGEAGDARLLDLENRLRQLQDTVEALEAQAHLDSVTVARGSQRVEAVEADVRTAASSLREQLESQGRSLQAALAEGLAEVRATAEGATPPLDATRLQKLEEAVARRDAELEDLEDLHAALDLGMGELRSGILAGRAADSRTADALDEIYRRIEALFTAQSSARAEKGRGRRSSKKSTEPSTDADAALTAVDELVREQHRLKAQLVNLQQAVDAAAKAAARAASVAAPLPSLRTDVRALHAALAEQKQALESLARTVERPRRKSPAPAPAPAKKAPRATRG